MNRPLVIDDETITDGRIKDLLFPKDMGRGLVPRDFNKDPEGMFAAPSEMDIIPRSEWSARIREQEERQSSAYHIYLRADNNKLPANLYQGQWGFCWAFSTTHCVQISRAVANLPYEPLSAFMVAYIIKGGQNEGGWSGQACKFLQEVGVCSQEYWPLGEANMRRDNAEMRENAKRFRVTDGWYDFSNKPLWGQQLTFEQVASCLLRNQPVTLDLNHWGHSVAGVQLLEVEPGSFGIRFLNSWQTSWGDRGFGILRGQKAVPDSSVGIRQIMAV